MSVKVETPRGLSAEAREWVRAWWDADSERAESMISDCPHVEALLHLAGYYGISTVALVERWASRYRSTLLYPWRVAADHACAVVANQATMFGLHGDVQRAQRATLSLSRDDDRVATETEMVWTRLAILADARAELGAALLSAPRRSEG